MRGNKEKQKYGQVLKLIGVNNIMTKSQLIWKRSRMSQIDNLRVLEQREIKPEKKKKNIALDTLGNRCYHNYTTKDKWCINKTKKLSYKYAFFLSYTQVSKYCLMQKGEEYSLSSDKKKQNILLHGKYYVMG